MKGTWSVDQRILLDEFQTYVDTNNTAYFEDDFKGTITYLLKGNPEKLDHVDDSAVCIQEVYAGGLGRCILIL